MAEGQVRAILAAVIATALDDIFDNMEDSFAFQWHTLNALATTTMAAEGTHFAALTMGAAALALSTVERLSLIHI